MAEQKPITTQILELVKGFSDLQRKTLELHRDTQKNVDNVLKIQDKTQKIVGSMTDNQGKILDMVIRQRAINKLFSIVVGILLVLVFRREIFGTIGSYVSYVIGLWNKLGPEAKFALVFTAPATLFLNWLYKKFTAVKKPPTV